MRVSVVRGAGHIHRLMFVAGLLAVAVLPSPLRARTPPAFTFRAAEFLPLDRGIEAAQAFVTTELPAGLSAAEARARLRRANMRCGKPQHDGRVVCDFAEVVHVEGGVLGEHHWTVTLTLDPSGRLAAAKLDQFTIGAGRPAP